MLLKACCLQDDKKSGHGTVPNQSSNSMNSHLQYKYARISSLFLLLLSRRDFMLSFAPDFFHSTAAAPIPLSRSSTSLALCFVILGLSTDSIWATRS